MSDTTIQLGHDESGRKAIILTIILDDDEALTLAEGLVADPEPAPPADSTQRRNAVLTEVVRRTPAKKTTAKKTTAKKTTARRGGRK